MRGGVEQSFVYIVSDEDSGQLSSAFTVVPDGRPERRAPEARAFDVVSQILPLYGRYRRAVAFPPSTPRDSHRSERRKRGIARV